MKKSWSAGVANELQHYVYRLIDPRDNSTFYVGMGQGDRVFQHALAADKIGSSEEFAEDRINLKLERINAIKRDGYEVSVVVHRHGLTKETAFEVEAALIDAYDDLSNQQIGHASSTRGLMTADDIERLYALPALSECDDLSLLLINVNNVENDRGKARLYDQVRFCWRLNINRARKADFVLAVERGVVLGAFVAKVWMRATRENFPEFGNDVPERWGFVGEPAPDSIWQRLVGDLGKRLTDERMRHIQNPVRYWNI